MAFSRVAMVSMVSSGTRLVYLTALFAAVVSLGQTNCGGGLGANSSSTCLGCHNGVTAQDMRAVLISAHAGVSCSTCHGNGTAHVQSGGEGGVFLNPSVWSFERSYASCVTCHRQTVDAFLESGHATSRSVSCHDCHNVHQPTGLVAPKDNNQLCQSCHVFLGFGTPAAVSAHTMHPVDPSGTGASRCTECHLPPLQRLDQDRGPHDHTLKTLPPQFSLDAINDGVSPVPPNSCAGITGCHDGTVLTAPVFDVDSALQMDIIQQLYELWFGAV